MKLNNKGFAFSTMLYGTLALITLILYIILGINKGASDEIYFYGDEIQIIVTAEDGSNRTYTITVHDSNNIMYTAIGIFIIGLLSVIVVIAYKNKKANQE